MPTTTHSEIQASVARSYGSANGSDVLFIVEARTSYSAPEVHCGMILDSQWRQVHFPKSVTGGIKVITYNSIADKLNLFNYEAALALATWFMAEPSGDGRLQIPTHAYCIETRIVKVKLTYSYSTAEVGVGEPMSAINMQRAAKFLPREQK